MDADYSHLDAVRARLLLAVPTGDGDGRNIIADEIEDCACCWRVVAEQLAECVARDLRSQLGDEVAIAYVQACIARMLDRQAQLDGGHG